MINEFLSSRGSIFAEFGAKSQDSGNISYGVEIDGEQYFVKTAGQPDDPLPPLSHAARVALLRNAARLNAEVQHTLLPKLHRVLESPNGPMLFYSWLDGELLGVPREQRDDPLSSFQRFRSLPPSQILTGLDQLFDLHDTLARAGWVAVDFYDGSLIYNFQADRLWAIDLDMYQAGPFHNEMGQMFGSTRFMAPEEFEKGAWIDQSTTVFTMGRTALVFLSEGTLMPNAFRGTPAQFEVISQACRQEKSERFPSMAAFYHAWQSVRV